MDRCVGNKDESGITFDCPFCESDRTRDAGFAMDYFCKLTSDANERSGFRMTSGYVEWDSDINPVPLWCPLMDKEEKVFKILESE